MHGAKNFPSKKMKSSLDINLPDKCEDTMYLSLLHDNLYKSLEICKNNWGKYPDIVFYLAGVDIVVGDKLGRVSVTRNGLKRREKMVLEFCEEIDVPIVLLTAGGYQKTSELTAELHAEVFREAFRMFNKKK